MTDARETLNHKRFALRARIAAKPMLRREANPRGAILFSSSRRKPGSI